MNRTIDLTDMFRKYIQHVIDMKHVG